MSPKSDPSLVDALKISIDRMISNFSSDWLVSYRLNSGSLNRPHYDDTGLGKYYEKTYETDRHPFTEICICLKGVFALQLENKIVDVHEGDVCPIFPGIKHAELSKEDFEYTAVWLSVDLSRSILHLSGKDSDRSFFTVDGYSLKPDFEYIHTVNRLKDEAVNEATFSESMAKTLVIQLFTLVLREVNQELAKEEKSNTWKESVVLEVQNYIQNNLARRLRLSDISQAMCISTNYLNTMFKSITGKTIMQYTDDLKLDMAKYLLLHTNMNINSISMELGYYDQYHFSNIFKKTVGVSPTHFRKGQLNFTSNK